MMRKRGRKDGEEWDRGEGEGERERDFCGGQESSSGKVKQSSLPLVIVR